MNPPARHLPKSKTATISLLVGGKKMQVRVTAPTGLVQPTGLLPQFESLADRFVATAVEAVEADRRRISCKRGCGACCRQLVPISGIEAQRLRELVNKMPERRRAEIVARFQSAKLRLENGGLLKRLLAPGTITNKELTQFGLEYFSQRIACPFLEEESCSIHPNRPLVCREYLVTSPPENCARPARDTVHRVKLPVQVSRAVRRLAGEGDGVAWVPLILALDWAEAHLPQPPRRTGTEWVEVFFKALAGSDQETPDATERELKGKRKPWWRFW
ncbi:MAG: YkgJ family cysteine cluster protein [Verrucomicrobiae bacterium]|nr:YkgJ family cysteine cluster protein [Verrucomicrobiae bacterium]